MVCIKECWLMHSWVSQLTLFILLYFIILTHHLHNWWAGSPIPQQIDCFKMLSDISLPKKELLKLIHLWKRYNTYPAIIGKLDLMMQEVPFSPAHYKAATSRIITDGTTPLYTAAVLVVEFISSFLPIGGGCRWEFINNHVICNNISYQEIPILAS